VGREGFEPGCPLGSTSSSTGICRISTPGGLGIAFNQFLIDDERPALIHTAVSKAYEFVRVANRRETRERRLPADRSSRARRCPAWALAHEQERIAGSAARPTCGAGGGC
jgi:hypothetical protein